MNIMENHKGKIDEVTDRLIRKVVVAPAFRMELIKPGYIKDTDSSGLKNLLD